MAPFEDQASLYKPPVPASDLEATYATGRLFRFTAGAEALIDAPVEQVWNVLSRFDGYGTWNPFTPSVQTDGAAGSKVVMDVRFPGKQIDQTETLVLIEPPHRLAWGTTMGHPLVLAAIRYQVLELMGSQTRYVTIDRISGLMAPLVRQLYGEKMNRQFAAVGAALKQVCEQAQ